VASTADLELELHAAGHSKSMAKPIPTTFGKGAQRLLARAKSTVESRLVRYECIWSSPERGMSPQHKLMGHDGTESGLETLQRDETMSPSLAGENPSPPITDHPKRRRRAVSLKGVTL
jgi:hypothetical protein